MSGDDETRIWDIPEEPREGDEVRKLGQPGDLIIGTSKERLIVRIKPDGRVQFGPGVTPDEAAKQLWEALARRRIEAEDATLVGRHCEAILYQIGKADLVLNDLTLRSRDGDPAAGQAAGGALVKLESLVHQAIEFGRALAARDAAPVEIPKQMPRVVEEDTDTEYNPHPIDPSELT